MSVVAHKNEIFPVNIELKNVNKISRVSFKGDKK